MRAVNSNAFSPTALRRVLFDQLGLARDAELAVAYSGGHDSQVLLHALAAARDQGDDAFTLTALHFDHALAAESADWAKRCEATCREWGVAFVGHREVVPKRAGESLEARARAMRYRWFARALAPGQVLLTAHHADDQAETVLLNLLRGGGVAALGGIAPLRPMVLESSSAESSLSSSPSSLSSSQSSLLSSSPPPLSSPASSSSVAAKSSSTSTLSSSPPSASPSESSSPVSAGSSSAKAKSSSSSSSPPAASSSPPSSLSSSSPASPLPSSSSASSPSIPPTRVARPLLGFSRAALGEYARRFGLSWIDDPSNQSLEFDRNFLRHSILPLLRQRWPGADRSLGAAAANCRDAAGFVAAAMEPLLQRCQIAHKRGVFCLAPPLDTDALASLGRFERVALLRCWLHRHGCRSPSSAQLATVLQQTLDAGAGGLRWDDWHLRCFERRLHLTRQLDESVGDAISWDLRARDLRRNGLRVELAQSERANDDAPALLDPARCYGQSLQLAWRAGGERMTLPGRAHSSALKKLFQQRAVPPWERAALPLLLAGDEVAWAHGIGAAATCCARGAGGVRVRFVADGA
ncbi:MAG: tRNA lysidine(34) synthetase TilS [Pseudohongiellaceae bacterium]